MMGEALLQAGRADAALASLASGLRYAAENGEQVHDSELHRLTGEIHLMRGDGAAGEASLRTAIEIAQMQKARMPELRASLALARIGRRKRRRRDLRALLEPLDAWFQEGRGTPEVRELRALLEPKMKAATPD
jgi:predicted ATPase